MASLEGDSLVVLHYLNASQIWPHKRGVLLMGGGSNEKETSVIVNNQLGSVLYTVEPV